MGTLNGTNDSKICEFTSDGLPLSSWLIVTVLQTVSVTLTLIVSLVFNVSFALVVIVHGTLRRQKDLMLTLVLTILNACNVIIGGIPGIATAIYSSWQFGKVSCYIFGTISVCFAFLRFTLVLAITADRFVAVMYPFQYSRYSAKVIAVILTIGGLYSTVTSLVVDANVVGCYNYDHSRQGCIPKIDCSEIYCYIYNIFQVIIAVSFGIATPMVLNIAMFYKAKKLRTTISCGTIGSIEMGEQPDREIKILDVRAIVTVALLLGSVVGLTLPLTLVIFVETVLGLDTTSFTVSLIALAAGDLFILIFVTDALVAWRNRDVKECASPYAGECTRLSKQPGSIRTECSLVHGHRVISYESTTC